MSNQKTERQQLEALGFKFTKESCEDHIHLLGKVNFPNTVGLAVMNEFADNDTATGTYAVSLLARGVRNPFADIAGGFTFAQVLQLVELLKNEPGPEAVSSILN